MATREVETLLSLIALLATRTKSEFFVGKFGDSPEVCGLPGIKFYKTDILTIIAVNYVCYSF